MPLMATPPVKILKNYYKYMRALPINLKPLAEGI